MILSLDQLKNHDFALSEISVIHQTPAWERLGTKNAARGRQLNGFILVTQGQCRYEWDEEEAVLGPGDLLYLPSGCRRAATVTQRPFSFYRISFVATELVSGEQVVFTQTPWAPTVPAGRAFLTLAEAMVKSTLSRTDAFRSGALLLEFLDTLSRQLKHHTVDRIAPALEYIEAHYTQPIDIPTLAQMCTLSESQFFAAFRKKTGMSPIRYRNHLRINQAKLLLASEESTVQEVAALLGFESTHYFSRVFKDHTDVAPSAYFSPSQTR